MFEYVLKSCLFFLALFCSWRISCWQTMVSENVSPAESSIALICSRSTEASREHPDGHSCQSIHTNATVHLLALRGNSHGIQLHILRRSDYDGNIVLFYLLHGMKCLYISSSCISKKNLNHAYTDVEIMVCSRTPPLSWLWFVPSPGARRQGFYHLWDDPIYG